VSGVFPYRIYFSLTFHNVGRDMLAFGCYGFFDSLSRSQV
jgi:hypothetical protein